MKSSCTPSGFDRLLSAAFIIALAGSLMTSLETEAVADAASKRLVLIHQHSTMNTSFIRDSFRNFIAVFEPNMLPVNIDFVMVDGFDAVWIHINQPIYSTIIYVLKDQVSNDEYCEISNQLSITYKKKIIFWPCPKLKKTEALMSSLQTVSFAVRSTVQHFNWTEAQLFATGDHWGLPLAIAAHLHMPLKIETIGAEKSPLVQIDDKVGKVILVCSSINAPQTRRLMEHLNQFNRTKTLLIDVNGEVFNNRKLCFRNFSSSNEIAQQTNISINNIYVLTIITGKLKQYLNSTHNQNATEANAILKSLNANFVSRAKRKYAFSERSFESTTVRTVTTLEFIAQWHTFYQSLCSSIDLCIPMVASPTLCQQNLVFASEVFTKAKTKLLCEALTTVPKVVTKRSTFQSDRLCPFVLFSLFDYLTVLIKNEMSTYDVTLAFEYVVMSMRRDMFVWPPTLTFDSQLLNQQVAIVNRAQPDYTDRLWISIKMFWACGTRCWIIATLAVVVFLFASCGCLAVGIAVRKYFLKQRLSKGPNKIVLSATDFVFPIDARRVDEGIEAMLCCWLQQLQEFGGPEVEKPDLIKGSIGSLKNLGLNNAAAAATAFKPASNSGSLSKQKNMLDMRARYNGDLVQLKEVSIGSSNELKSKAMDHLVMMHGLRHENVNPLIGWLSDPNRNAMVFEYCSRGSLQDVLIMDDIKLDWSFRLSLLTDLVRGMRYLHGSSLRVHGSLSSRNCVVDARWVLKITDYGLQSFKDAQGIVAAPRTAKELLWTAPELVRYTKGQSKCGTQTGDVYSFGIIMQEVVVRGEPYCMLSLSPEEIIAKIKKPPPLIRPSVSKGAAPPEAINIMRQCWAEQPDMRPDFNSVYERFKQLNHGRKVNFVDTMFQMLEKYSNNLEELIRERTDQLDFERKKTEQLLNRMLPSSVADKLKMGLCVEPEEFSDVTIYFSDIVGFTTIAAHCSPVQVVDLLNDLYTCFDDTINAYSVYKVETIGDAYMVVSGLPVRNPDHAEQIATMALDLLHQSGNFKVKHLPDVPLQLRIGLHTGPCCAGVVGLTMPRYCLFGDTVNTASRMESTGSSWRIHLSEVTRDRLEKAGGYQLETRGPIEIKGKGLMTTYWLLGKMGFDKILPTPPPIGLDALRESTSTNGITVTVKAPYISSTNQSSSQSSSIAGEVSDVKVEITPPKDNEIPPSSHMVSNSFSLDSNATNANCLYLGDFKASSASSVGTSTAASPHGRKFSEIPHDTSGMGLLNPGNIGGFTPTTSTANSASKLYKKIEELMDLSSPYNHYRCLSPSESNLTQCTDAKYMYTRPPPENVPGSSRLLRRQFSLDRDDCHTSQQLFKQTLDIPMLQEQQRSSPINLKAGRLHKQGSTSVAVDLKKIEEIPISQISSFASDDSVVPSVVTTDLMMMSKAASKTALVEPNEISLNVDALILR